MSDQIHVVLSGQGKGIDSFIEGDSMTFQNSPKLLSSTILNYSCNHPQTLNQAVEVLLHCPRQYAKVKAISRELEEKGEVHPTTGRKRPEGEQRLALPYATRGWMANATPHERVGIHCTGGWVGPTADLDGCGKSRPIPNLDSIPGSPGANGAATLTDLSQSTTNRPYMAKLRY